MPLYDILLSLAVRHPTRELQSFCDALGMAPKHIWADGDKKVTPAGNNIPGIRLGSYCLIDLNQSNSGSLEVELERALATFHPHKELFEKFTLDGGTLYFYVGLFCKEDTAVTFNTLLLGEFNLLNIGLDLHIYLPDQQSMSCDR